MAFRHQYPDPAALAIFSEIASGRTFAEAAARFGITVSAVSQTVTKLERDFGAVLIDRSVRPAAVTVSGRNLARAAEPLLRQMEELKGAVKPRSDRYSVLRIGLAEAVSRTVSPWVVKSILPFADTVSVKTGMTRDLLGSYLDRETDVLVSASAASEADDTLTCEVLSEDFFIVLPRETGKNARTADDVRRIAETLPLIRYNALAADRIQTEKLFRNAEISLDHVIRAESSRTMMGLAAQNAGWAFMPPMNICDGKEFADGVVFLRPEGLKLSRTIRTAAHGKEFAGIAGIITDAVRKAVREQVQPALSAISPELVEGMRIPEGKAVLS